MTPDVAHSQDDSATLAAILEAIVSNDLAFSATVYEGRAVRGAVPPFVTMWPLDPQHLAEGLPPDSWGVFHHRWQVDAHGDTIMTARVMLEAVTSSSQWADGWEHVETGPLVEDTTDEPASWFYPVTFIYRGMT